MYCLKRWIDMYFIYPSDDNCKISSNFVYLTEEGKFETTKETS